MSARAAIKHRPVSAREALALNLIRFRKEHDWSQEDLALECGLHRTFVAHVERQARNISLDNVEKLASALGVQTFELLLPPGAERKSKNDSL